jgi:multiple sugar transport system permease protein
MSDARILPYILLLPAALFLGGFFLVPFLGVAYEAITGSEGSLSLGNFQTMAQDWRFWPALSNTLGLALVIVPIQVVLALAMASLVTTMSGGREIVLYVLTIPLGISDLAAGLIWLAILEQNGFLTTALNGLGIISGPQNLLSYQNLPALFAAVVVAEVWRATAIVLVILVAGMGLIPKEYYEAAEVFGAGAWKRFVRITLPLLRPSLQTALILRTILAFEVFGVVAALAGTNLPVLMGETYKWQFEFQDRKVASAYAMVLLGISIAFTVAFLWLLRDRTEERS